MFVVVESAEFICVYEFIYHRPAEIRCCPSRGQDAGTKSTYGETKRAGQQYKGQVGVARGRE